MAKRAHVLLFMVGIGLALAGDAEGKNRKCYQYCWPTYCYQSCPQFCQPCPQFCRPFQTTCADRMLTCPMYEYMCVGDPPEVCYYYAEACDGTYVSWAGPSGSPLGTCEENPDCINCFNARLRGIRVSDHLIVDKNIAADGLKKYKIMWDNNNTFHKKEGAAKSTLDKPFAHFTFTASNNNRNSVTAKVVQVKVVPNGFNPVINELVKSKNELAPQPGIGHQVFDDNTTLNPSDVQMNCPAVPIGAHAFIVKVGLVDCLIITHSSTAAAKL